MANLLSRRPRSGAAFFFAVAVILVVLFALTRAFYATRLPDTKLTVAQKSLSYAKYFSGPMAEPSPILRAQIAEPMDCSDALPINEINRLLDPGYQKVETGYCVFPDGGGYASLLTKMPGVTLDMFNWWFIWHLQEPLRYKLWDKDDHFDVQISDADRKRFNDASVPLPNRLWGSTHHVRENIGLPLQFRFLIGLMGKDPYSIKIHFIPPEECGFDMKRFNPAKESVVCADAGMRHYVRQTADGIELRTRFYAGYVRKGGVFVREGASAPISIEAALNHHMMKEFTNLASILPALFAEQAPPLPSSHQ